MAAERCPGPLRGPSARRGRKFPLLWVAAAVDALRGPGVRCARAGPHAISCGRAAGPCRRGAAGRRLSGGGCAADAGLLQAWEAIAVKGFYEPRRSV